MPTIEKIIALGAHKRKLLLENAEKILDGSCTKLASYSDFDKEIVLSFTIVNESIAIGKKIVKPTSIPLDTVYISQVELREQGEKFLGIILHKFLSMKDIEKSKVVPKMCDNSKEFQQMILDLPHCDDKNDIYSLQKKISENVSLFKKDNNMWIQSHWDKNEEDVRKEIELADEQNIEVPVEATPDVIVPPSDTVNVESATVTA